MATHHLLLEKQKKIRRSILRNWVFILLIAFPIIFIVHYYQLQRSPVSPIFQAFHDCVFPRVTSLKGRYEEFWYTYNNLTEECDNLNAYNVLNIQKAPNADEIKYVVLPTRNKTLTMVTLGIGNDVNAEIKLKELYSNINFFGADPVSALNQKLYEKDLGGKYYQYAVSGESGVRKSLVFQKQEYKRQSIAHIEVTHFLRNILKKNLIDLLWIDIEGNEYSLLDKIHKNAAIDLEGIKICQMNIEFHKPVTNGFSIEMKHFHDFVFKILEDGKYILMKPVMTWFHIRVRFNRIFIVNVADSECTDLFLKK